MEFSKHELYLIREALAFGVVFSNDEAETAEFVLLKLKLEKWQMKNATTNCTCGDVCLKSTLPNGSFNPNLKCRFDR